MKLSIKQALLKGVAAHREGKLQEAERFYRAILQTQPAHSDANHNLGILAAYVDKTDVALPFLKKALEANPKIEQFWFSYIKALMKEQQFEDANESIEKAKTHGLAEESIKSLEAKLALKTKKPEVTGVNPSQELLDTLFGHYQNRCFSDAEKLSIQITKNFPKHQFAWTVLGAVMRATGRKLEAADAYQTAVALSPQDAAAHNNLGVLLQEIGRLDEAEASFKRAIAIEPELADGHSNLGNTLKALGRLDEAEANYAKAIALKPDFPEAYSNLGNILKVLGKLEEAEGSYAQAIMLKPDFAEAHFNLGNTLKDLGRLDEAVVSFMRAIAIKSDYEGAYVNLGIAIKNIRFTSSNPKFYPPLIKLLIAGNFTRPQDVAASILSLLKHDMQIKCFLLGKSIAQTVQEATAIIEGLDKVPLLHHLMRVCPLPELRFEARFVAMRSFITKNLDKFEVSTELIHFLSTLSIHCFINEYIFVQSEEEAQLIDELQARISKTVEQSEQPEIVQLLCLASYRPLHQYDWCQKLDALDHLQEVKKRLIEEPLFEKMLAKDIPVLDTISNDVSLKVKKQYEENPYPRWVKLRVERKAKSISEVCDHANLQIYSEKIRKVTSPSILIAGCGTGQHSIQTAFRFSNCRVTAVDLSLASLAYARRKSNELSLDNVEYFQADILQLHEMGKEYDIIESVGVLHHMDEPMVGWSVLVDLLKPGGLMNLGLYSELARQHIVKIRGKIASLGLGASGAEIRNFRQSIAESRDENDQKLIMSNDFFSLSMLRDSIFHVQEHRFTLPQIADCLDVLGLKFCGFENKKVISDFRKLHKKEADIYDLELWHQFEERNPQAFVGMYQFWCQKKAN